MGAWVPFDYVRYEERCNGHCSADLDGVSSGMRVVFADFLVLLVTSRWRCYKVFRSSVRGRVS